MNEIETIFCKLRRCRRSSLYLDKRQALLGAKELSRLENILKKRISGEPLQYLIGDVEFMGLPLKVKPGVLIPRPETEILVEEVIKEAGSGGAGVCVLDIGTGTGNIAIALAKFIARARIYAVDISKTCLALARSNARLNGVKGAVGFFKSDLFSCFKDESFDIIVSNPPYISRSEYESLPQEVRREPVSALLAQEDGLYFYKRIEEGSRRYLSPCGSLFLEIGDGQAEAVAKIFSDKSFWKKIRFVRDLCGIQRVAIVRKRDK